MKKVTISVEMKESTLAAAKAFSEWAKQPLNDSIEYLITVGVLAVESDDVDIDKLLEE